MADLESALVAPRNDSSPFKNCYMDLEPQIRDLERMAQIAFMLAQNPDEDDNDLLLFSVGQFHEMCVDLKKAYAVGFAAAAE
jgi:hypothetical protein